MRQLGCPPSDQHKKKFTKKPFVLNILLVGKSHFPFWFFFSSFSFVFSFVFSYHFSFLFLLSFLSFFLFFWLPFLIVFLFFCILGFSGQSGLGKTTLFNTIFEKELLLKQERSFEERKEIKITQDTFGKTT